MNASRLLLAVGLLGANVISSDSRVARHGRCKLIGKGEAPAELYDLVEDLEEKNNRMSQHPEIAKDLVARRKAWQQAGGLTAHQKK